MNESFNNNQIYPDKLFLISNETITLPDHYLRINLIFFTRNGSRQFHTIDIDKLVDSIHYYSNIWNKEKIVFLDVCESFEGMFIEVTYKIVEILKQKYNFDHRDFLIGTGALPIEHNLKKYKEICLLNNLQPISLILQNTWECRMSVHINHSEIIDSIVDVPKDKKILFLNGQSRSHRALLLGKLSKELLLDYFKYSYHKPLQYQHSQYSKHDPKYNEYMKPLLPYFIGKTKKTLSIGDDNPKAMHRISLEDIKLFKSTFISLIAETMYFKRELLDVDPHSTHLDSLFLTEKTYRAIACKHPFILANRPYALKTLRELGYKTFNSIIDESYDDIEDDYDRLDKIIMIIKDMCSKGENYWIDLSEKLTPIVEHNFEHLKKTEPRHITNTILDSKPSSL